VISEETTRERRIVERQMHCLDYSPNLTHKRACIRTHARTSLSENVYHRANAIDHFLCQIPNANDPIKRKVIGVSDFTLSRHCTHYATERRNRRKLRQSFIASCNDHFLSIFSFLLPSIDFLIGYFRKSE